MEIGMKKLVSRAQAVAASLVFTALLVVGQGMEAKGQEIEVVSLDRALVSSRSEKVELQNLLTSTDRIYYITESGHPESYGGGRAMVIHLQSARLLNELSLEEHSPHFFSAEVLTINLREGDDMSITPEMLARLTSLRYIYIRGSEGQDLDDTKVRSFFEGFSQGDEEGGRLTVIYVQLQPQA